MQSDYTLDVQVTQHAENSAPPFFSHSFKREDSAMVSQRGVGGQGCVGGSHECQPDVMSEWWAVCVCVCAQGETMT